MEKQKMTDADIFNWFVSNSDLFFSPIVRNCEFAVIANGSTMHILPIDLIHIDLHARKNAFLVNDLKEGETPILNQIKHGSRKIHFEDFDLFEKRSKNSIYILKMPETSFAPAAIGALHKSILDNSLSLQTAFTIFVNAHNDMVIIQYDNGAISLLKMRFDKKCMHQ